MTRSDEKALLVTGFGPFQDVTENPSGALASWCDTRVFGGLCAVGTVLPVSVERVPAELERACSGWRPRALVGLGVQKGADWRVERSARVPLTATKVDVDGAVPSAATARVAAASRATDLDLDALVRALAADGHAVRHSDDAGGYVCEWLYFHLLELGQRLGVPALFVHVPHRDARPVAECRRAVTVLLEAVVAQLTPAARRTAR